jgi:1,4-alpha-glucan branching enzyme
VGGARRGGERGALAIVLHTHMPYVEGFGTWPAGEEWLWEAIVGSYLPLLDLLDEGAPLTLSLTPVLCDQLEADGVYGRFRKFIEEIRSQTHAEDAAGLRRGGHEQLALELERSSRDYESALGALQRRGGDLLGGFAAHAQWTSAATHAVLPLLASDAAVRLQLRSGINSHRARFDQHAGSWRGGLWLPECAYSERLEPLLEHAGARAACVELTGRFGLGAREHLQPLQGDSGVVLVPIDRASIALVWSEQGYPADGAYRDYHHRTTHDHRPWANDGSAYRHPLALARAREHAADFVARTIARLREAGDGLPGGGLVVFAVDTELFGHWWYEGVAWLGAVVEQCAIQGLELLRLDDALERFEPAPWPAQWRERASSWGQDGDLSTWSAPDVAEIAFQTRAAELDVLRLPERAGDAAVRELLALQSSDWAFMSSRAISPSYGNERFQAHLRGVESALAAGPDASSAALRNLAPHAHRAALFGP